MERNRTSQGFSLIEMMIAMAIVGLVVYLSSGTFSAFVQRERVAKNSANLLKVQQTLMALLREETAWQSTLNAYSGTTAGTNAFRCWSIQTNCPNGTVGFIPRDESGNLPAFNGVAYNPTNARAGFDLDGNVCSTFDPANPDPACPFRFTFTRRFDCGPVDCVRPRVTVQMDFDDRVLRNLNQKLINVSVEPTGQPLTIVKKGVAKSVVPRACQDGEAVNRVMADGFVECRTWATLGN